MQCLYGDHVLGSVATCEACQLHKDLISQALAGGLTEYCDTHVTQALCEGCSGCILCGDLAMDCEVCGGAAQQEW